MSLIPPQTAGRRRWSLPGRHSVPVPALSGVLTLLLGASPLHAQEALRSALLLDRSIEQRPPQAAGSAPVAEGPHLGPVGLTLSLYERASYEDNISLLERSPRPDTILGSGAKVGLDWAATERSSLRFGTEVGYIEYLRNRQNSGIEIQPDSALTYQVTASDLVVTLFDQLSYSRRVLTEGALANVTSLPRLNNTIGARLAWSPGRWSLEQSYSHNTFIAESKAFEYLNRSSDFLFLRAGWGFTEATRAGLEASATLTAYDVSKANDNHAISLGPFAELQILPTLRVTARGGPSRTYFDSSQAGAASATLRAYFLGGELTQQLTPFLSHTLNVTRDVQPGLYQGSSYIEELRTGYTVNWALTAWMTAGLSLFWESGKQPFPVQAAPNALILVPESYDRYGLGPSLGWRFTDHFSLNVGYAHTDRHSTLRGRGYQSNSTSLQLSYSF